MINLNKLKVGHWPVFFISLLSALMNLFLPIILVRLISPEEMGLYKLFFLYAQSIIFISLAGGPLYSVYYFVGKKKDANQYLEQAWILNFAVSFICALIGFAFLKPISVFISMSEKYTILLLLSAITSAPSGFYGEFLIAKGKKISGSLFNSGFEILKAIVIIGSVYFYRDIHIAFWGFTILFIIKLLLAIFFSIREKLITFTIDQKKFIEVTKYCAPISIAGAMSFIVEKIDMIILSSRLDPIHFAFYSMGCLVVPPLLLLEMSVQKILIPELSKSYHNLDFPQMVLSYRKAQSDISYIMIPALFGLMIFNRPIIEILFTSRYIESSFYLRLYALTYLTYIIPHDSIPRATGNTQWILKMYLILTPLSIGIVYFCAGQFGAPGALISSVTFMFFPKIPGLIFSAKLTKTSVTNLIAWRAHLFYTFINLILLALVYLLKPIFSTEKMWFIILGPLYAFFYLGAVNLIKFFKNKKENSHAQ
ncbi:MAG: oligosaccharide flippase family protein [Bacteriovorax sp.]|jgi:O-antigen/teichoic acid export membrane protein|nr:oligosaccharide flippase family protein [Bacteriovorax sp.]